MVCSESPALPAGPHKPKPTAIKRGRLASRPRRATGGEPENPSMMLATQDLCVLISTTTSLISTLNALLTKPSNIALFDSVL